ncbi:MAG: hypothetical protein IJ087_14485 [Eggerthellaceae bacterium]|nr:hypothetical protein [Eggerthellaceae bacterium]
MPTNFDLLVAAKAVEKTFAKRVKALETQVKDEFIEKYRNDGTDRMRSTVFDGKAAWMTMKGGKPSETVTKFQMTDAQAVIDWMDENRPETDSFATDNLAQFAQWWFEHTGECPDGCKVITYDTEPTEPTPALTVKEAMVLPVLQDNPRILGEVNELLLGEGEDAS